MSDTSSDGARPQSTTRTLKPRFTDGETEARRGDGIPLPAEPVAPPPPSGSRRRFPPLCRPAGAAPPALRPRRLPGRQRSGAGRGAPRGGGLPAALPRGLGGRAGRRGPFPFCSRLCPPFLGARQGERSRGAEQRRAPPPLPRRRAPGCRPRSAPRWTPAPHSSATCEYRRPPSACPQPSLLSSPQPPGSHTSLPLSVHPLFQVHALVRPLPASPGKSPLRRRLCSPLGAGGRGGGGSD